MNEVKEIEKDIPVLVEFEPTTFLQVCYRWDCSGGACSINNSTRELYLCLFIPTSCVLDGARTYHLISCRS